MNKKVTNNNKRKRKNNKKHSHKGKMHNLRNNNNFLSSAGNWRTVTRFAVAITMNTSATTSRVDIIPYLSLFPIRYQEFLNYRFHRISYQLIPRFNISTQPGSLPVLYSLPVSSNQLPAQNVGAFIAFPNCRIS